MQKKIMSIDLEYDFDSNVSTESIGIIPKILDLFDDNDVRATFFAVGELAGPFEDLIKEISKKHEIASHSYSHPHLDRLDEEDLDKEIRLSKESFENIGIRCRGFRAPFLITDDRLGNALKRHGFEYDSSIGSFFPGRFSNFLSPKRPYRCSIKLTEKGDDLIELPIPDFTLFRLPPSALSYYRLFYPISRLFTIPYLFYFHPYEFVERGDKESMPYIIRHLSSRNHGKKAWVLFKDIISRQDCTWVSCSDYIKSISL